MASTFRVYKQFIPALLNEEDPDWAKRQVWVAKLNNEDTVDEYETEALAQAKADELSAADPTDRQYKVVEIAEVVEETPAPEEVGERPTDSNTKAEITAYMDANSITYSSGDTKATLLEKIDAFWAQA